MPGRPLHAELVPEVRHDLPVPVELRLVAAVERPGVQRDAVGGSSSAARRRAERVDQQLGERAERRRRRASPKSAAWRTGAIHVSYGYADANGVKLDEVAALRATSRVAARSSSSSWSQKTQRSRMR